MPNMGGNIVFDMNLLKGKISQFVHVPRERLLSI